MPTRTSPHYLRTNKKKKVCSTDTHIHTHTEKTQIGTLTTDQHEHLHCSRTDKRKKKVMLRQHRHPCTHLLTRRQDMPKTQCELYPRHRHPHTATDKTQGMLKNTTRALSFHTDIHTYTATRSYSQSTCPKHIAVLYERTHKVWDNTEGLREKGVLHRHNSHTTATTQA